MTKKHKKRDPKKTLRNRGDKLFQIAGKLRWGLVCEGCGRKFKDEEISCHHFIGKDLSNALRYDLRNAVPLCIKDHIALELRKDPIIGINILKKRGENWLYDLMGDRHLEVKANLDWYKKNIEILETFIKIYGSNSNKSEKHL